MATRLDFPVASEDNASGDLAGLSAKQCEVLDLLLEHKSNKEIARLLGISPSAVDQRLAAARLRLGTTRRGDTALAYARLKGTCVNSTGGFAQVASGGQIADEDGEDEVGGLLLFEDIGLFPGPAAGNPLPWPEQQPPHPGLRGLAVPASPLVRLGLIIVFALLIVVVALIGMSVTQSVVVLLG